MLNHLDYIHQVKLNFPKLIYFVLIGLACLGLQVLEGVAQFPFITNYSPDEYGASGVNWGTVQDQNGLIYVANSDGVLIYDGNEWELVRVRGRAARSITFHPQFGVLVGTSNDFGKIVQSTNGDYGYQSIIQELNYEQQSLKTVFNLHALNGFVFVETQDFIYRYDGAQLKAYPFPTYIISASVVNTQLYVVTDSLVYAYENNGFKEIGSSTISGLGTILYITETAQKELLVCLNENELYVFPDGLRGKHIRWNSKHPSFLNNHELYLEYAQKQDYPYFLFSTHRSGLLVLSSNGEPLQFVNRESGIINNQINDVFIDAELNIWLSTANGLSKVSFEMPITQYGEREGLPSPILSVLEHTDGLYVGTNVGLFFKEKSSPRFRKISKQSSQVWKLVPFKEGVLAAAGNLGVYYVIKGKVVYHFPTSVATMTLTPSVSNPNQIWLGLFRGAKLVELQSNKLTIVKDFNSFQADVRTILEDATGNVWFGTRLEGLFKLSNPSDNEPLFIRYDETKGLSHAEHNFVFGTALNPVFSSKEQLYTYSAARDTFLVQSHPNAPPSHLYPILRFDGKGKIWSLSNRYILQTQNTYRSDSTSLKFFKSELTDISPSSDDSYWLTTREALYNIQLPIVLPEPPKQARLKRVSFSSTGKNIDFIQINDSTYQVELPPHTSASNLEMQFPTFIQEKQVRYRYRITNINNDFTAWQASNSFTIAGLPYRLNELTIETVAGTGRLSKPITLFIYHQAPLYLRWYFLVISGLLFSAAIFGFITIRNNQILKRNEYLEHVVQTRTDEVRQQNEQLKLIANEMAGVNQLKSKMLQMAVHDLRNPLAVLIGYVDILRDEKEIQQQTLVLQSMERVIEKMLSSIESLLSLDEKGLIKPDTKRQKLDLRGLVVDVIADNSVLANLKQQTIESELEANCIVLGDRYQLIEVFENILNNAIKYAPLHSKIGVRLFKKLTNEGNYVRFCVIDSGPGIKDEDRERIFTPYAKSENNPTAGEASSGLGLSIVKEIVQWHNGKIWVENSAQHTGSTFVVELPLA